MNFKDLKSMCWCCGERIAIGSKKIDFGPDSWCLVDCCNECWDYCDDDIYTPPKISIEEAIRRESEQKEWWR